MPHGSSEILCRVYPIAHSIKTGSREIGKLSGSHLVTREQEWSRSMSICSQGNRGRK